MADYVIVRNMSNQPCFFSFLPPHGKLLAPGEALTIPAEAIQGREKALHQAAASGRLALSVDFKGSDPPVYPPPEPGFAPIILGPVTPPLSQREAFFNKHKRFKRRVQTEE